jgi:hypothetical protein
MSAQFSETIHYKGHQTTMCSNPLSDYFLMTGKVLTPILDVQLLVFGGQLKKLILTQNGC